MLGEGNYSFQTLFKQLIFLLPGEVLPLPLGLRVGEVGEGAPVDLAVFYCASVYEEPSFLHVLMGNIYALQSTKTGTINL